MPQVKKTTDKQVKRRRPVASNPEIQEKRMINYAMQLAEEQLMNGTASPSVITHFLKLGSMRERRELERLENENKLLSAKTGMIESSQRYEELISEAMRAFTVYSGGQNQESDDEDDEDDY